MLEILLGLRHVIESAEPGRSGSLVEAKMVPAIGEVCRRQPLTERGRGWSQRCAAGCRIQGTGSPAASAPRQRPRDIALRFRSDDRILAAEAFLKLHRIARHWQTLVIPPLMSDSTIPELAEQGRKQEKLSFAGSDEGGRRAAIIYTLIETARLNDVDPEAWLDDVISRIADHPNTKINELLPWEWTRAGSQAIAA